MSPEKRNLAASVRARLLNRSKQAGFSYQTLLVHYAFERFLYRMSRSGHRESFVLKGAMLLRVWSDRPYRATRDLDLLRQGRGAIETVEAELRTILSTPVEPDAIDFDVAAVRFGPIRIQEEQAGMRAIVPANCGTARLRVQIDVGVGEAVWPAPRSCTFPGLLDLPAPNILAYPRDAVVAEKLEAMITLGEGNSRIKDFFDLHYLATHFEFDRVVLKEAIRRTFARRGTRAPAEDPVGLTLAFWEDPSRLPLVRSFSQRAEIPVQPSFAPELTHMLREFLLPIIADLREDRDTTGTWHPGGPWLPPWGVRERRAAYASRVERRPSTNTRVAGSRRAVKVARGLEPLRRRA